MKDSRWIRCSDSSGFHQGFHLVTPMWALTTAVKIEIWDADWSIDAQDWINLKVVSMDWYSSLNIKIYMSFLTTDFS